MEAALLYLLKTHAVLALFAAAYYGLLRQLTFFTLNRAFLLLTVVVAVGYPLLPAPVALAEVVPPLGLPAPALTTLPTLAAPLTLATQIGQPAAPFPWLLVGLGSYAAGSGWLGLGLLGQLLSLARLRRGARPAAVLGQAVWLVPGAGGAFSFGKDIYLTASSLADAEHLPAVLRHEQAHVRQAHTLNTLLLQLLVAAAWVNPAAWLLRRAALANLEYLADRAALPASPGRYAYLRSLVSQQAGGAPVPALAFRPATPTLKKRVLMLSQLPSSPRQLGRYLLAAPLLATCLLGLAACERPQAVVPAERPTTALLTETKLTQPNGRPINVHLVNTVNLNTEVANHYMRLMNSLSAAQQQAREATLADLQARPDSTRATREQLARLFGFASLEEQTALDQKWQLENQLAHQEDPAFYRMSKPEQLAVYKIIIEHNRRTGGPTVIALPGAPATPTDY